MKKGKKKKKPEFDIEKCLYVKNPCYLYGFLDPYTAPIARFLYNNFGLTANITTLITFILGMVAIVIMYFYRSWWGLLIVAILITIRNIGDTVDGKIARGTNMLSPLGGYSDIIADWLFFHAAFFIVLGIITNHILLGALCVIGYMSREFARRKFTERWGVKITETKEVRNISFIVSLARKYDLASWFLVIPLFMITYPVAILYVTIIIEYGLLFGELIVNFNILIRDNEKRWREIQEKLEKEDISSAENVKIKNIYLKKRVLKTRIKKY